MGSCGGELSSPRDLYDNPPVTCKESKHKQGPALQTQGQVRPSGLSPPPSCQISAPEPQLWRFEASDSRTLNSTQAPALIAFEKNPFIVVSSELGPWLARAMVGLEGLAGGLFHRGVRMQTYFLAQARMNFLECVHGGSSRVGGERLRRAIYPQTLLGFWGTQVSAGTGTPGAVLACSGPASGPARTEESQEAAATPAPPASHRPPAAPRPWHPRSHKAPIVRSSARLHRHPNPGAALRRGPGRGPTAWGTAWVEKHSGQTP